MFKHDNTDTLFERPYSHFYSLMPTTTHSLLSQAGLADSTGFLDVDPETLQHKTYSNIFGVGDVLNVPTTKSFYGGLAQVAVVRNNVERRLNGLSLNAKYDGYAKVELAIATGKKDWDKRQTIAEREANRDAARALAARNRGGRASFPDDIAAAAVFLASPEAWYVNGTCLVVDGAGEVPGEKAVRHFERSAELVGPAIRRTGTQPR